MPKGWLMRPLGEVVEVPEHILDNEEISYPWTLPELASGQPVQFADLTTYRRHELIAGEAYLYLRDSSGLERVNERDIRRLLGPLAAQRPTVFPVVARSLAELSRAIGERTIERHAGCVLVVPDRMWSDASKEVQTMFHNLARIESVEYRREAFIHGGAYWHFDEGLPA